MASRNPTQRVRRLHQALLGFFLATAGLVFQVCSAEFPRDIHEWEEPCGPRAGRVASGRRPGRNRAQLSQPRLRSGRPDMAALLPRVRVEPAGRALLGRGAAMITCRTDRRGRRHGGRMLAGNLRTSAASSLSSIESGTGVDAPEAVSSIRIIPGARGASMPSSRAPPSDRPGNRRFPRRPVPRPPPQAPFNANASLSGWNDRAARMPSTTKSTSTAACAMTNGGSVCVGASAFRNGNFRNACTTPTKTFR